MFVIVITSLGIGGAERQCLGLFKYIKDKGEDVKLVVLKGSGPDIADVFYLNGQSGLIKSLVALYSHINIFRGKKVIAILPFAIKCMQLMRLVTRFELYAFHRSLSVSALKKYANFPKINLLLMSGLSLMDRGRIYISHAVRNDIQPVLLGRRMELVHYNVIYDAFKLSAILPKASYKVSPKFLYIGRLAKIKGVLEMITSWPFQHELTLCGEGPLLDKLQMISISRQIKVKFKNSVSREEVGSLMNCYDVIVVPSLIEGFGNVIVEAACLGKWMLINRIDGIAEAIDGYPRYVECDFTCSLKVAKAIELLIEKIDMSTDLEEETFLTYISKFMPHNNDKLLKYL